MEIQATNALAILITNKTDTDLENILVFDMQNPEFENDQIKVVLDMKPEIKDRVFDDFKNQYNFLSELYINSSNQKNIFVNEVSVRNRLDDISDLTLGVNPQQFQKSIIHTQCDLMWSDSARVTIRKLNARSYIGLAFYGKKTELNIKNKMITKKAELNPLVIEVFNKTELPMSDIVMFDAKNPEVKSDRMDSIILNRLGKKHPVYKKMLSTGIRLNKILTQSETRSQVLFEFNIDGDDIVPMISPTQFQPNVIETLFQSKNTDGVDKEVITMGRNSKITLKNLLPHARMTFMIWPAEY